MSKTSAKRKQESTNHDNGSGNRSNQNNKMIRNQQKKKRKKRKTSYSNQKIRFWVDSCNPTKKPPKNVDKESVVKLLITAVELSDNHKHGNIYNHVTNKNDENEDENIINPAIQLEEEMKTDEVVEDIQQEEVTDQNDLNENEISATGDVVEQEDDKSVRDDDKNRQERNEEMKKQVEDKVTKSRTGNPFIHVLRSKLANHHRVRLFQLSIFRSFFGPV